MKVGDIFIYGDVYNQQSEQQNTAWGEVSLTSVKNQVKNFAADTDEYIVHIHSRGGDVYEGFAIHDYLRTLNKPVTTKIEGLCASIATIIALAGDTRQMTENSTFMIHNPQIGLAFGDADEMEDMAEYLREIEDKIINFYAKKTGQSRETLDTWMKEEKFMTPDEAKELGFITDVIQDISAVAVFNFTPKHNKDKTDMTKVVNKAEENLQKTKSLLDRVTAFFNKDDSKTPENNLSLNLADGRKIEIVTDQQIPNPGDRVSIDGKAVEDGEYTLSDKTVIVVKDSLIEKVTDPDGNIDVENSDDTPTVESLQEEIVGLRTENETLTNEIVTISGRLETIANSIESGYVPKKRTQAFNTKKADDKTSKDPVAEAIARRREREEAAKNKK